MGGPDVTAHVRAPFRVAEAIASGRSRGSLRSPALLAPTTGIRIAQGELSLVDRVTAYGMALPPDVAFSHLTAARLLGLPCPSTWPGPAEPLDVMRDSHRPAITRSGVRWHRGLESRQVLSVQGLRLVAPRDTWADLGSAWDLGTLVAAGDLLLRTGAATPDDLVSLARTNGRRNAMLLRDAASLARPGAASPRESQVRVLFHEWGLPEPELNVDLCSEDGVWLARPDFTWRRQKVLGEYDGDQHRTDRRQWQHDRHRRARLEDHGWTYVEISALTTTSPVERERLRQRLVRLLSA